MIYVTGDTHREFSRFSRLDLTKDDMIIVLGDVGINYYLDSSDDRGGMACEAELLQRTGRCVYRITKE